MKKIDLLGFILFLLVFAFSACSSSPSVQTTDTDSEISDDTSEAVNNTEEGILSDEQIEEATAWFRDNDSAIALGVYRVGKDLEPGDYTYTCISEEYGNYVTIFESTEKYLEYHKSSRFTTGEENEARTNYSLIDKYVGSGKSCSLELQEGYVLSIGSRPGTLTKEGEKSNSTKILSSSILQEGEYMPGTLEPGTYFLTGINEDLQTLVVVFEDSAAYDAFKNEKQDTVGEYSAALEKTAWFDDFVKAGESTCITITDQSIILLDYAGVQIDRVDMSWK